MSFIFAVAGTRKAADTGFQPVVSTVFFKGLHLNSTADPLKRGGGAMLYGNGSSYLSLETRKVAIAVRF
jgi:hypothetical protein